jgi:fumarylacetoacetate (FAA) hydrolase family protein
MREPNTLESLSSIVQVIGVAYTYRPSLAVRRHLVKNTQGDHSAKKGSFSYFYKGDNASIVGSGQKLTLRRDPVTGKLARHWPEPELAILLGKHHEILAYTLANDLTAISIEARGRTADMDGTYEGKAWDKSGSLGPRFIEVGDLQNVDDLPIGLRIERRTETIYDRTYRTSRRIRRFPTIPDAVVDAFKSYGDRTPPSKRIDLDGDGFLLPGTVIMLGTGLILSEKYACMPGDRLTVYCPAIGELKNEIEVTAAQEW